MRNGIKEVLQEFFSKYMNLLPKRRLPRAVPSAEEAILPFNPADYSIEPRTLKHMIEQKKSIVLLDVRDEWEYRIAHIDHAQCIPLGELPRRSRELNPYAEIVVYCHRGMRSLDAAYLLQQLGFKRVRSLVGGIVRWASEIDPDLPRY
ncbi:MAG: rhodanese-like domain-containing protein [Candidatus Poribacteria bacterium]|nr:rhodanese-like domain-containing protein [Candidatus Poribacteria bacterium]